VQGTGVQLESFASISSKLNPLVSGTFSAMNNSASKPMMAKSKNVAAVPIASCSYNRI
jgi:hypothetical protein